MSTHSVTQRAPRLPLAAALVCLLLAGFDHPPARAQSARWNPRTTDWAARPEPTLGDWGFNRPGYPPGLYIHGVTVQAGQKIENPLIYDNDVYDDVFDDELALLMASRGDLNLAGLIVTPVLTDFWGFSKPDWPQTAIDSRARAQASGLRMERIPPISIGTEAPDEKAAEGKSSAGARLYVRLINEQYQHDPARPTLVNIGGQSATLASAYTLDPDIAARCVVYYTDLKVYNGHYKWASELVARHFRVISWGDDNWWITRPCQNQWRVLPRPLACEGQDNSPTSGEWRQLSALHSPLHDHIVHQLQTRGEYAKGDRKADAYADGTFLHAWIPAIFDDASLQVVRGSEVLHVTRFTARNEDIVKNFTMPALLAPWSPPDP